MAKEKLLTIKEFAELASVSVQSVYKRLSKEQNELKGFVREIDGQKFIMEEALEICYKNSTTQPVEQPSLKGVEGAETTEKNEENTEIPSSDPTVLVTLEMVKILKDQVAAQKIELEEKNKQIENLSDLLKKEQENLKVAQSLAAADKQRILELEDKVKAAEDPIVDVEVEAAAADQGETVEPDQNEASPAADKGFAAASTSLDPAEVDQPPQEKKKENVFKRIMKAIKNEY